MDFNRFYLASQDLAYAHPYPDFSVSLIPISRPTPTGQYGMRGDCFSRLACEGPAAPSARDVQLRPGARFHFGTTAAEGSRRVASALFPHFHASTRPIHQSIDSATKHGIFATNDAKALKALRTLRPTLCELCGPHHLIAGTMALSGMTVLSMDEILLRTEISRMRKEGTRRRASERNRRGYGRDKRGPPA